MFYILRPADYGKSDEENLMLLYINADQALCQQLRTAGAIIDNLTTHQVILFSLGDSYKSFIIATTQFIRQSDNDNKNYINVDHLIGQLLDKDRRQKGVRHGVTEPGEIASLSTRSALYSNRKQSWFQWSQSQQSQFNKPCPICNYCEREGHKQDNCWDLHPEKKTEFRYTKHARLAAASIALASAGITPGERDLF
jgi:hypothetical protein